MFKSTVDTKSVDTKVRKQQNGDSHPKMIGLDLNIIDRSNEKLKNFKQQ